MALNAAGAESVATDLSDQTASTSRWIDAVLDEFEAPLLRYAARLLGGDAHRAADVVQDVFMRLCETDRATLVGRLAPWLYTVCRNRALDVRRKEGRMTTLSTTTDNGMAAGIAGINQASTGGSTMKEHNGEQHTAMMQALDRLPEREQEAIRLKFEAGMSYREIADVLKTSASNVGVIIHNAMKTLRNHLGAHRDPGIAPARIQQP